MRAALRWIVRAVVGAALLVGVVALVFASSPWPGALLIRALFDHGAERTSAALARHVPARVVEHPGEVYDAGSPDGGFDVFLPPPDARPAGQPLPLIVWVHGGGAVSGSRRDVANYARVLAGKGVAVATLDYSIAPEATYPTPVRQVNQALGHLAANASRWGVDADRFVLAGDSAGAQIAAQVANLTVSPNYAKALGIAPTLRPSQLRALLLFCGPYIMRSSDRSGVGRWFMHTVLWAYSGTRDYETAQAFAATANVLDHLTADSAHVRLGRQRRSAAAAFDRPGRAAAGAGCAGAIALLREGPSARAAARIPVRPGWRGRTSGAGGGDRVRANQDAVNSRRGQRPSGQ
jgi:acetyl esterase/lipase